MSQESFTKADFEIDPDAIEARFTNEPPRPQGQIKVDTAMENVAAYYGQDPVTMVERPVRLINQSTPVKTAQMNDEEVSLGDQVLLQAKESLTSDHTRTTHPIVQDVAVIAFGTGALTALATIFIGVGETIKLASEHPQEARMMALGGLLAVSALRFGDRIGKLKKHALRVGVGMMILAGLSLNGAFDSSTDVSKLPGLEIIPTVEATATKEPPIRLTVTPPKNEQPTPVKKNATSTPKSR